MKPSDKDRLSRFKRQGNIGSNEEDTVSLIECSSTREIPINPKSTLPSGDEEATTLSKKSHQGKNLWDDWGSWDKTTKAAVVCAGGFCALAFIVQTIGFILNVLDWYGLVQVWLE